MAQVTENDRLAGPYVATAGQVDFPADFPLLQSSALRVRRERAGVASILSGPDVAAIALTEFGFTARLAAPAKTGDRIWIYSELPASRMRAHTPNGSVRTPTLEGDAEEFQAQLQEHRRRIDASISVPPGEVGLELPPASQRTGGRLLGFHSVDGQLRVVDGAAFKGDPGGNVMAVGLFSAAGSITVPEGTERVQTTGYDAPGVGAASYAVSPDQASPAQPWRFQSADGRWFDLNEREVWVEQFIQAPAVTVNHAAAFQAANDFLSQKLGGGTIRYNGRYRIATDLLISRNVSIVGPSGRADPGNPFADRDGYFEHLQTVAALIVTPGKVIRHFGAGGLRDCYVLRAGLVLDGTDEAAAFTGTAIRSSLTDAVFLFGCSVLGFDQAVLSEGTARVMMTDVLIDCQNGIKQDNSFDRNTYTNVHCYNVLQGGITGNTDPRVMRTGKAFYFTGSFNGGPSCINCFSYGFRFGFYTDCEGSYSFNNCWVDGPHDAATGRPLDPLSVGYYVGKLGASPNAEPLGLGLKIACQATGIYLGPTIYGLSLVIGAHFWLCGRSVLCDARDLTIIGAAIRGYFDSGIEFGSKDAADTAKLIGITFYDRQDGVTVDVDCGGGDPFMSGVTYSNAGGDTLKVVNRVPFGATRDGGGLVIVPDGRDTFEVVATSGRPAGAIGDMLPRTPGRTVTVVFAHPGFSLITENFKLSGGFGPTADSSITLRCNAAGTQWVEQKRQVF